MDLLRKYPFPSIDGQNPKWNGKEFLLEGRKRKFLCYSNKKSNWSSKLTKMHEKEAGRGNHPIDLLSRDYAHNTIKPILKRKGIVLDVGCSSGFLLREIFQRQPKANVIGADYLSAIVGFCARDLPGVPMLQFDLRFCPLPANSLDAVVALNVLEHIDEDQKALWNIFQILKPGGVAHIEVPAGPLLYDFYDEVLMHHRRYGKKELVQKCKKAGFRVCRVFGIGWSLYPLFCAIKIRNRILGRRLSDSEKMKQVARAIQETRVSPLVKIMLRIETFIDQLAVPLGIRYCVVLEKP